MVFAALSLSLLLLPFASVSAAPKEDEVSFLPLVGPVHQYSGYLDATPGCDTETNGAFCKLHYWFAPSTVVPPDGPIVLWLNGGPGSSSILGFLQELGPYLLNSTGGLMENPWAWTNVAHVLVMESPIGVGYSYCANQLEGKLCKNTDKYTASAMRAALVDFFSAKFPELSSNPFYITGESYAGIYVPTLTKEVLDNAPSINLRGIAVGDPCTDNTAQADAFDPLWYGHKYGLVDDFTFDLLWNKCNARFSPFMTRKNKSRPAKKHALANGESGDENDDGGDDLPFALGKMTDECMLAARKFMLSSSKALSQSWKDMFIDDYSLFAPITPDEDNDMAVYLNRPDVKKALHVEETPITNWPTPDVGFDYTSEYDACNAEPADDRSMVDFYREVAPQLDNVWVYNGDTDPCVTYEGTRTAIARVGYPEIDGGSYRPWFYNQTAASLEVLAEKAPLFGPNLLAVPMGAQFGGEVVNYENNLSFLTIHGSGHMVPQFRPQAALHMLSKLLKNEPLSPLLPSNETITKASAKSFRKMMDDWTESAKKAPYVDVVEYGVERKEDGAMVTKANLQVMPHIES